MKETKTQEELRLSKAIFAAAAFALFLVFPVP